MKVGDVIEEKYELTNLLGEGGIVQTFEAVDRRHERKVIVKRLDPELGVDADVIERLVFEAQTVGGMGSEFTVAVLDSGEADDGLPYLVMERLEGSELSTIIKRERRPFAPHRAVSIALQLCRGVGAAHQRGVLHLGLRPQKLLVSRRGVGTERLKILDFGFARVREMLSEQDPSLLSGPPYYTAPEILQETHEVDHLADIYSAGVILYELLTGKVPFQAESFDDLVVLVATTNPRKPRDLRPNLSEELEQVVLRAIDREADRRYSNMEELSEALAPFASSATSAAPPPVAAPSPEPVPIASEPPGEAPSKPEQTSNEPARHSPAPAQRPPEPPLPLEQPSAPAGPPRVGPPLKNPSVEPQGQLVAPQSPSAELPTTPSHPAAASPAPPPVEPPRVTSQPLEGVEVAGPMASPPPPVASPTPSVLSKPDEPARVVEPPRVERQAPPAESGAPATGDSGEAKKPEQPRKLRASERAVLEAGKAKPAYRDEVKRPQPQAPASQKKSPLLRLLLVVLIVGVLLGSAVAVGLIYLERLDDNDSQVTSPPQKALTTGADTSEQPHKVAAKVVPPTPRPEQSPVTLTENRWVTISGAGSSKVVLGVSSDRLPARVRGFRPALGVMAPDYDFEIQQHEVSIGELSPWLMINPDRRFEPPDWLPETDALLFPATGVPWGTAQAYCESIGAALPTEVEWEFAARGIDNRSNPWGSRPIDLEKTHAFRPGSPISKIMTNDQDATPGEPEQALFDMVGNALEWTSDQYRIDGPESEERLEAPEGVIFRAIRGLPPAGEHPGHVQTDGSAYRSAQCAEGPCQPTETARLVYVGFRCVRRPADAPGTSPFPAETTSPTIEPPEKIPPTNRPPQKRRTSGPIAPNPYR